MGISKGEYIGSYPHDVSIAVVQISIWDPFPSEMVGKPPGIGEGGQQRAFEALKTIDVTKGQESDGEHHDQEEEEPEMQGHDLKIMIYHKAIEMEVWKIALWKKKENVLLG